jgi:hypothetical protein
MAQSRPKRLDIVRVYWIDTYEDPTGCPEDARLAKRESVGLYWGEVVDADGNEIVVTTTTEDKDAEMSGWCAYPKVNVYKIEIIKRGKKRS